MGVFQIESRAQMAVAAAHAARDARRPHDPGRDRAPGADPRRRGQPLHRAPPAAARGPGLRRPLRAPVARAGAASDTLGTIIFQDQVIEVAMAFAGFSPGEAEGLRRAMSRKRSAAAIEAYHQRFVEGARATHGVDEETAERVYGDDRRLLGLRLPQGPRRRLRPARLPVDLAARALRPGVPVRAAQRAADGLLRARHARPRGPAARDRAARRRTSTRVEAWSAAPVDAPTGARRSGSASATCSACAATRSRRSSPRARTAGPFRSLGDLASRAGAGRAVARAARLGGRVRLAGRRASRRGARAATGAVAARASPRPASAVRRRARSSRCRSSCRTRRELRALDAVGVDGRRLRDDRADARPAPDGAAARRRCRPARSRSRDLERAAARRRRCGSAGSSSRASGRARRRASCSCCSRTSSGRST